MTNETAASVADAGLPALLAAYDAAFAAGLFAPDARLQLTVEDRV